jgi:hypothetical protein
LRTAYQDQQAAGYMTLTELGAKLRETESTRRLAKAELEHLLAHKERVEELEQDRDALLESYAETAPDALDNLSGEERNRMYGMLRVEVTPASEGLEISGALCTSELLSTPKFGSTKQPELRFRALLAGDVQDVLFERIPVG